ncbi:MAG: MEKHLA domain-containing protein [Methylobacter sp.]
MDYPAEINNFLLEHAGIIRNSYRQLLGKELIPEAQTNEQFARLLFYAPFTVISHDREIDPVFNYANLKALELFELGWEEFTRLPSRLSAEAANQAKRDRLLAEVTSKGYIDCYSGIRVSKTGKRFLIKNAVIWNLRDDNYRYKGQAACFKQWEFL